MILHGLFRLGFCMQAWYFTSFFSCRCFSVWYNGHEIPLAGFIYAGRCAAAHCGDAGRPPAFCCSWIICLSLSLQNLFSLSLVGVLFRGRLFFVAFYVAACYRRAACRQLAALASRFARRRAACGNAIEE